MSKTGLAILSAIPALTVAYLFTFAPVVTVLGIGAVGLSPRLGLVSGVVTVWCLVAPIVLSLWTLIVFVRHARRNPRLSRSDRAAWIAAFVLALPVTSIVYVASEA
jgi:hypothetical protein